MQCLCALRCEISRFWYLAIMSLWTVIATSSHIISGILNTGWWRYSVNSGIYHWYFISSHCPFTLPLSLSSGCKVIVAIVWYSYLLSFYFHSSFGHNIRFIRFFFFILMFSPLFLLSVLIITVHSVFFIYCYYNFQSHFLSQSYSYSHSFYLFLFSISSLFLLLLLLSFLFFIHSYSQSPPLSHSYSYAHSFYYFHSHSYSSSA